MKGDNMAHALPLKKNEGKFEGEIFLIYRKRQFKWREVIPLRKKKEGAQEGRKQLPDFNNRSVLVRFCEKQSKATKQALEESDRLQAASMARAFTKVVR